MTIAPDHKYSLLSVSRFSVSIYLQHRNDQLDSKLSKPLGAEILRICSVRLSPAPAATAAVSLLDNSNPQPAVLFVLLLIRQRTLKWIRNPLSSILTMNSTHCLKRTLLRGLLSTQNHRLVITEPIRRPRMTLIRRRNPHSLQQLKFCFLIPQERMTQWVGRPRGLIIRLFHFQDCQHVSSTPQTLSINLSMTLHLCLCNSIRLF